MDLAEQFAAVWRRRVAVLLVAVLAAAAVFAWRSAAPETYRATATLQVRVPTTDVSDPSTRADYYAAIVIGLVTSREVVTYALAQVRRVADPGEVADRLDVGPGTQPGFVVVTAEGDTPRRAAALANALVTAADRRVRGDQAGDAAAERDQLTASLRRALNQLNKTPGSDNAARAALIREREDLLAALRTNATGGAWRVATVDSAEPPAHPVAPTPVRDALLAFLLTLIVVAEGIVVVRAWRGAVSARDPADDVAAALDVPAVGLRAHDGVEAVAALLPRIEASPRVTVAQLGRRPDARAAMLLSRLLAARGRDVLLVDASPGHPSLHRWLDVDLEPGLTGVPQGQQALARHLRGLPRFEGVRVLTAGRPDETAGELARARLARIGAAAGDAVLVIAVSGRGLDDLVTQIPDESCGDLLLVVPAQSVRRRTLREAGAAWRGLGVNLTGAVVKTSR